MACAEVLSVEVVYCPAPGRIDQVRLEVPAGSTIADAIRESGVLVRQGLTLEGIDAGVWGKAKPLDSVLRERDRIELYRGLKVDPKEARRLRYKQHRAGRSAAISGTPRR